MIAPAADIVTVAAPELVDVAPVDPVAPVAPAPPITPAPVATAAPIAAVVTPAVPAPAEKKPGFFARLKQGLSKTEPDLGNGLASLFLRKKIDEELYEELETQLLMADVGVENQPEIDQTTDPAC